MGGEAGGQSWGPVISGDGRYVAFHSTAWDLVPGDTNGAVADVFVWDATTGTTTRITDGNNDSFSPAISADGRYITFYSSAWNLVPGDLNGKTDVFVWDATTGSTTRISDGDRDSFSPAISADGRNITYLSAASNLVPGDTNDTNDTYDVFVWDATTGTTTRISDGDRESHDPAISADGRYISYTTASSNLVPGDTNDTWDVLVWDATTGTTTRITDGVDLENYSAAISADGRYITYFSLTSNLVPGDTNGMYDVFVWDATTGTTARITDGDNHSASPTISADGRYITFYSLASNLVPGDTNGVQDVFAWDATTGTTARITDGNDTSSSPSISADGNSITFPSAASNLVPDDTNGVVDVFVWHRNN
jgi:Tol biopolymer transport system component